VSSLLFSVSSKGELFQPISSGSLGKLVFDLVVRQEDFFFLRVDVFARFFRFSFAITLPFPFFNRIPPFPAGSPLPPPHPPHPCSPPTPPSVRFWMLQCVCGNLTWFPFSLHVPPPSDVGEASVRMMSIGPFPDRPGAPDYLLPTSIRPPALLLFFRCLRKVLPTTTFFCRNEKNDVLWGHNPTPPVSLRPPLLNIAQSGLIDKSARFFRCWRQPFCLRPTPGSCLLPCPSLARTTVGGFFPESFTFLAQQKSPPSFGPPWFLKSPPQPLKWKFQSFLVSSQIFGPLSF